MHASTRSRLRKRVAALLIAATLTLAVAPSAQATNVSGQIFDAVIVRPLRTIAVAVGAVLFVPAAIVTSPGGADAIGQAYDKLIGVPIEQAFQKPLGEF